MLRELDEDTWETLARCFQFRLLNHWTEEDQDMLWARQLVTMVKKKNGQLTMGGFRLVAMLPTMFRLYSKVLQQLVCQAIHTRYGPQYGHVLGRQAHEVVFILRRKVERANEWQILIFVMDFDVAAAFDHVSHHLIIDAMEALKVPAVLLAVWVREYRRSETYTKFDDILTPGVRRTRSVPQSDPCAAKVFGVALDVPATAFCKRCQAEKCAASGWELHGVTALRDNCWLTAMSPSVRCVARAWNELLVRAGLRIAWKEAVWCTSAPDSLVANIEVDDTVITRTTREQGFKALGAWITFEGHFAKELAEREVIAWRSFFAIRRLLCDNKVAFRHRLRLLSSCVTSSLYWCSGSWILTQSQCTHLRAIQDKMLRRMICVPRHTIETPEAHMIRWSKLPHNCRRKHKILHGDETYFASYFSWCGHVARLTKVDPQRETSRIFTLKNVEWLRNLKREFGSQQCHRRRVRGVEMEAGSGTVSGHRLDERGTGSDGWRANMDAMIKWKNK